VLDGAMGTRLIARGLDLSADDPALWTLSRPECVAAIHAADVTAGADAILTNTFGANEVWLDRFGRSADAAAINRSAAGLARAAAGPTRFVIGSIGPTASTRRDAVRAQAEALEDSGVDALLFETHSLGQAINALRAIAGRLTLPRIVSLVAWPNPIGDAARRLEDLGAAALGANCENGMEPALLTAERLASATHLPLLVKPNAGMPPSLLQGPEEFAARVPQLLACGLRLVGGCCGTTEAHVAALRRACYAAP
jgi:homocysteine S-methyltransferase